MINWRQLYNESQAIQVDETNISTEVIETTLIFDLFSTNFHSK